MPWKATSVMQARLQFVADCLSAQEPMTVLCERYGISRQTGYKWTQRFAEEGARGLEERSRAPHHHGRATAAELVVELIQARQRKPYWGPKKLLAMLGRQYPDWPWPAPSTVADMLRREGLSEPRRRRRRALTVEQPFAAVNAANDAWCIDFKGWFRTGDGTRCDPLTVSDAHSRYLLGLEIIEPVTSAVEKITDRLFGEYGLPARIRSDNGPPFASSGAGGLTRLSARWAKMGIGLERIYPGKPQQNGRHERMHGTLKAQTCDPPAQTAAEQQRWFDAFRQEYNFERPHEALDDEPPASLWTPSQREYPNRLEPPEYPGHFELRRVSNAGHFKMGAQHYFISHALKGDNIGLEPIDDGLWNILYYNTLLGRLSELTGKISGASFRSDEC